ncbi:cytoplasmic protein [Cryobacterium tagatosivorans]|uniref:Cytoplasmic protein n=1 Tax=Cryobacterium tagatosivorans TaxID=1259199 RepID=A0A4R8UBW9_9MICO|nr:cytoplasmic protein [Cryobacterium tagatosivorans]TFB47394.1 cytoplasmic protein [Cryobacterium tagatosivorans]
MSSDPVVSNPGLYRVIMENERVRVLEYRDGPGDKTTPHHHPDSVMFTLSSFRRRLSSDGAEVDVELPAGVPRWLPAQVHAGENIGDSETHTIFVELKDAPAGGGAPSGEARLGPSTD